MDQSEFAPIRVLGCMSGTSMDGVDAAMLVTDGADHITFHETRFRPFSEAERDVLRVAQGRWQSEDVTDAGEVVLAAHRDVIAGFTDLDLVGFHGQTLAHDPARGRTHQVGDGAALARAVRVDVAWDFRTADMAAGGVGAPLAPFFHHACLRARQVTGPVAVLNLGGVANVSFVDPVLTLPETDGALLAFDCGPANALMDDLMRARRGLPLDTGGALAAAGQVAPHVVADAMALPFFKAVAPKAADRNEFGAIADAVAPLGDADAMASLLAVTVAGVVAAQSHFPMPVSRWLVTGGGRHNRTMMAALRTALPVPVDPVEDIGLNGDALEAQAFAWLAVRSLRGLPLSAPGTTGCREPVTGGRVAYAGAGRTASLVG